MGQNKADADFASWVLSCAPIIKREVARLMRLGCGFEALDGLQEGMLILLENEDVLNEHRDNAFARIVVRRGLVSRVVQRRVAKKRSGTMVSIDELLEAMDDGGEFTDGDRPIDEKSAEHMRVPSHEDDVVDRVTAAELADLMPVSEGGSRQAKAQMVDRWLPMMKRYVHREAA